MTECTSADLDFQRLGRREIRASIDAPAFGSDAGGLLLRELEEKLGIVQQFTECFDDYRSPIHTIRTLEELLKQPIFGIALGYEDLNDPSQKRKF